MSNDGVWPYPRVVTPASYRARALTRWQHTHQRAEDTDRWRSVVLSGGVRHKTCQWLHEAAPVRFCGALVSQPGCSWCAEHVARVFQIIREE